MHTPAPKRPTLVFDEKNLFSFHLECISPHLQAYISANLGALQKAWEEQDWETLVRTTLDGCGLPRPFYPDMLKSCTQLLASADQPSIAYRHLLNCTEIIEAIRLRPNIANEFYLLFEYPALTKKIGEYIFEAKDYLEKKGVPWSPVEAERMLNWFYPLILNISNRKKLGGDYSFIPTESTDDSSPITQKTILKNNVFAKKVEQLFQEQEFTFLDTEEYKQKFTDFFRAHYLIPRDFLLFNVKNVMVGLVSTYLTLEMDKILQDMQNKTHFSPFNSRPYFLTDPIETMLTATKLILYSLQHSSLEIFFVMEEGKFLHLLEIISMWDQLELSASQRETLWPNLPLFAHTFYISRTREKLMADLNIMHLALQQPLETDTLCSDFSKLARMLSDFACGWSRNKKGVFYNKRNVFYLGLEKLIGEGYSLLSPEFMVELADEIILIGSANSEEEIFNAYKNFLLKVNEKMMRLPDFWPNEIPKKEHAQFLCELFRRLLADFSKLLDAGFSSQDKIDETFLIHPDLITLKLSDIKSIYGLYMMLYNVPGVIKEYRLFMETYPVAVEFLNLHGIEVGVIPPAEPGIDNPLVRPSQIGLMAAGQGDSAAAASSSAEPRV